MCLEEGMSDALAKEITLKKKQLLLLNSMLGIILKKQKLIAELTDILDKALIEQEKKYLLGKNKNRKWFWQEVSEAVMKLIAYLTKLLPRINNGRKSYSERLWKNK